MNADMTSKEAAEALREADQRLRLGADAIGPDHRTRYLLVTGVLAVALGACFDIPASLWGVGAILRFPLPFVVILVWTLYTRRTWRARPRVAGYGGRVVGTLIALHIGCQAAAIVAGLALRSAGVPVAFTLAGLIYAVLMLTTVGLAARRLAARYADRMAREPR
jgi:hypothetical protein